MVLQSLSASMDSAHELSYKNRVKLTVKKCFLTCGFNLVLDQPTANDPLKNDLKLLSTINEKVDCEDHVKNKTNKIINIYR